jgi:hypothetical protein
LPYSYSVLTIYFLFWICPSKILVLSTILASVSPLIPPTLFVLPLFLYRSWLSLVYNFFDVAFSRLDLDVVALVVKIEWTRRFITSNT